MRYIVYRSPKLPRKKKKAIKRALQKWVNLKEPVFINTDAIRFDIRKLGDDEVKEIQDYLEDKYK